MPSWKKIITSGSDATLNSLYAPSITGSLLGTASYATQALSASWAPGAGSTFPYTGDAQISGSLGVTTTINAISVTASFSGNGSGLTNLPKNAYLGQIQAINQIMYNF